jgi:ElaB/YqjD/DUF883 family membrane-anchored ribosome-binding protein
MDTIPMNDIPSDPPVNAETAALRAKVDALTGDRVHPAVVAAADQAQHAVDWAGGEAERWAAKVRERPLSSIGIAALAGFVFAKVTRR